MNFSNEFRAIIARNNELREVLLRMAQLFTTMEQAAYAYLTAAIAADTRAEEEATVIVIYPDLDLAATMDLPSEVSLTGPKTMTRLLFSLWTVPQFAVYMTDLEAPAVENIVPAPTIKILASGTYTSLATPDLIISTTEDDNSKPLTDALASGGPASSLVIDMDTSEDNNAAFKASSTGSHRWGACMM